MKFSVLQENLLKTLNIAFRAIPTKGGDNILSNFLISTENGRIKIAATNFDTAIITYVGGSIEEEGSFTVPAKLFKDYVSTLSSGTINVFVSKNSLVLESAKAKSKLNGTTSEDYPSLPSFPQENKCVQIDPKEFVNAISLTAFAASLDESRPVFTGIYFKSEKGTLTIAATDGFRLSEIKLDIGKETQDFNVIVPSKTALETARIFSSSNEPIEFYLDKEKNTALFRSEDTLVSTGIIDGQYVDYQRIVPKETIVKATVNQEEFIEGVKLTTLFAKNKTDTVSTVKVRLDPEGNIKITSLSGESGEHESNMEAEVEGEITEIAFSSKYLLDYLNNVKGKKVTFKTMSNTTPCVIETESIPNFTHIIMPMQI